MDWSLIEQILNEKIGLDASVIGSSNLAKIAESRMKARAFSDPRDYGLHLQQSPQALEELIEATIVPETWFFRDAEPFRLLSQYAIEARSSDRASPMLRVLSVPCSTGEEPYSIAIALIEAGLTPEQFQIDAVDISKASILKAKQALYGKNSFREPQLDFRERYFTPVGDRFQLHGPPRHAVNFQHGNLLDFHFGLGNPTYDVIFCRNLLIYFDSGARNKALKTVERAIAPHGLLFVGYAETGLIPPPFTAIRHPRTFAYRYAGRGDLGATLARLKNSPPSSPSPPSPPSPACDLKTARQLANLGELEEAATICTAYLSQNRLRPEAHYLLGQIYQAMGKEKEAQQCFQKTLYLEPTHYEALIHLALLKEQQGDRLGASRLRDRLQRSRGATENA